MHVVDYAGGNDDEPNESDISLPPLPPGYKGVSLIEAINTPIKLPTTDLPTTSIYVTLLVLELFYSLVFNQT